jgi:hypothetical protein
MLFLLRSSKLSLAVAAAISLLLLGSSISAKAMIMDTPLPFSIYAGGNGCTDDTTIIGTGTTISFMAIENAFGSFCEIGEFPNTESNETDTSAVTTLYTKLSISSCHLNTTGLVWTATYNCIDSGCGNCSDVIDFSGFWNVSSYKDNEPLSYLPNQDDECFGFQSITRNLTELESDGAFSAAMSTDMQLALAENSTTVYQKFGSNNSITQAVEEYWKILYDHSCMGDDGSNSSDTGDDMTSPSTSTSISFIDAPLAYTDYGDSNDPDTYACVESNVLDSGYVMTVDITDDGCLCETDNAVMPDGSLQESYAKWMMFCEPPEEVVGFVSLPPPGDALYSSLQICTTSDCTKESCGSKMIAYTDWSFVNDPNSCLGWTWYGNGTTDILQGMENTTEGYFRFPNATSEQLNTYWSFLFDNIPTKCVATHNNNNNNNASSASTSTLTTPTATFTTPTTTTTTTDNDTDGDGDQASGSSITTLVLITWTSMILLFALVFCNN